MYGTGGAAAVAGESPHVRQRRGRNRTGTMSSVVSLDLGLGTPRMARGGSHLDPATALAYDGNERVDRDSVVERIKGLSGSAWEDRDSAGHGGAKQLQTAWEDGCDCCAWCTCCGAGRRTHSARLGQSLDESLLHDGSVSVMTGMTGSSTMDDSVVTSGSVSSLGRDGPSQDQPGKARGCGSFMACDLVASQCVRAGNPRMWLQRWAGLMITVASIVGIWLGSSLTDVVPRPLAGCLLLHIGGELVYEGFVAPWNTLSWPERIVVWVIALSMLILGFEQGILIGIAMACAAFIFQAASQNVASRLTHVEQAVRARARAAGISSSVVRRIRSVALKGTLFFGNAGKAAGSVEHSFDSTHMKKRKHRRRGTRKGAESQSPSPTPSASMQGGRRYLILDCSDISSIDFSASELVAAALDQLLQSRTTVAAVDIPENLLDHLAERGHSVWVAPEDAGQHEGSISDDDGDDTDGMEGGATRTRDAMRPGDQSSGAPGSSTRPSSSVMFGQGIASSQLPPGSHHWVPLTEWPTVDAAMEYIEFLCSEFHPSKRNRRGERQRMPAPVTQPSSPRQGKDSRSDSDGDASDNDGKDGLQVNPETPLGDVDWAVGSPVCIGTPLAGMARGTASTATPSSGSNAGSSRGVPPLPASLASGGDRSTTQFGGPLSGSLRPADHERRQGRAPHGSRNQQAGSRSGG